MSKEKQIEEMADVLERAKVNACATIGSMNSRFGMWYATALYTEGYRKQSEGEWVTKGDIFKTYHCSVCNYSVDYPRQKTTYCPECGARMGGGAE